MLDDREFGLLFLEGATNFTFSEASRQFLDHKYFFIPHAEGTFPLSLMWLEREPGQSRLSFAEVKNEWNCILIITYGCVFSSLIERSNKFTFHIYYTFSLLCHTSR